MVLRTFPPGLAGAAMMRYRDSLQASAFGARDDELREEAWDSLPASALTCVRVTRAS